MALRPKHYFLAPTGNPPEGPIQLGNIISAPHLVDDPINESHVPIDTGAGNAGPRVFQHDEPKCSFSVSASKGGKLGLWASFLVNLGLGADVSVEASVTSEESWDCDNLRTMSVVPTLEYITKSLEDPGVQNYMRVHKSWLGPSRLYMVVGIKIACGATSTVRYAERKGLHLNFGANLTAVGTSSLQVGPDMSFNKNWETKQSSAAGVEPFVFAFRLRKIRIGAKEDIRHEQYNKGALIGIEPEQGEPDDGVEVVVLGLDDEDLDGSEFREQNKEATDEVDKEDVTCTYIPLND